MFPEEGDSGEISVSPCDRQHSREEASLEQCPLFGSLAWLDSVLFQGNYPVVYALLCLFLFETLIICMLLHTVFPSNCLYVYFQWVRITENARKKNLNHSKYHLKVFILSWGGTVCLSIMFSLQVHTPAGSSQVSALSSSNFITFTHQNDTSSHPIWEDERKITSIKHTYWPRGALHPLCGTCRSYGYC